MVSTLDSESSDPSSNLGGTYSWLSIAIIMNIFQEAMAVTVVNKTFYPVNADNIGIIPGRTKTTSRSLLHCSFRCLSEFTNCGFFIYDQKNRLCLPGIDLGSAGTKPAAGQRMYLLWPQNCDVSLGYNSSIMKTYGLCLYASKSPVTFSSARSECDKRQGQLVTLKTMSRKLALLDAMKSVSFSECWVGLNDMQTEGVYVWSDGSKVTTSERAMLFAAGQPDNNNTSEDCGAMKLSVKGVDDITCTSLRYYFCEYIYCNIQRRDDDRRHRRSDPCT
ncbi:Low affinity immunoglobulin epsilon Fc receptor [Bulinus truncatus]|nr:Low affinity immunoglobulin epsilon Fc receptor [Bulinus truncatus]